MAEKWRKKKVECVNKNILFIFTLPHSGIRVMRSDSSEIIDVHQMNMMHYFILGVCHYIITIWGTFVIHSEYIGHNSVMGDFFFQSILFIWIACFISLTTSTNTVFSFFSFFLKCSQWFDLGFGICFTGEPY